MLDNVELTMYMKFQKLLMTGYRDVDKNIKNTSKMGIFPHLWPPKILFQKSGTVTFVPLRCPNFIQKIRKNQWTVSEKDGPTTDQRTDGQGRLLRTPSGEPGVKKDIFSWLEKYCFRVMVRVISLLNSTIFLFNEIIRYLKYEHKILNLTELFLWFSNNEKYLI